MHAVENRVENQLDYDVDVPEEFDVPDESLLNVRMTRDDVQLANEYRFSRKFIDRYIQQEINENKVLTHQLEQAAGEVFVWLSQEFYASKQKRLRVLRILDKAQMTRLLTQITIKCAYCQTPELFTSITSQIAHLCAPEKPECAESAKIASIKTASELLVHLARVDVINIVPQPASGVGSRFKRQSLAIEANFVLSDRLVNYVCESQYLPPLVCEPQLVSNNRQSGYLTHNDSVVLNGQTDKSLALDVINTQNRCAFKIDLDFALNVADHPNKPLDTVEKQASWNELNRQTNMLMLQLLDQTQHYPNRPGAIYFNHKFDKRGRMYCQGYHLSYQGTPWRKAMLEFEQKEHIACPAQYRT